MGLRVVVFKLVMGKCPETAAHVFHVVCERIQVQWEIWLRSVYELRQTNKQNPRQTRTVKNKEYRYRYKYYKWRGNGCRGDFLFLRITTGWLLWLSLLYQERTSALLSHCFRFRPIYSQTSFFLIKFEEFVVKPLCVEGVWCVFLLFFFLYIKNLVIILYI